MVRDVQCIDELTKLPVSERNCNTSVRPVSVSECKPAQSCPEWTATDWSSVSTTTLF